ncbi:MAG: hypothetical protein ACU0B1_14575 [Thermohalobaculum sp.]|jgi:hypothetical protein
MAKSDRTAFARKHAAWLVLALGAALLFGILRQNPFAIGAGVVGLIWVVRAYWAGK